MSSQILLEKPPCDVAHIMRDCMNGEEHAWAQLVNDYGKLVYSTPCRLGMQKADAEEVYQTVFVRLFENLPKLRNADHRSLTAWLAVTSQRESWRLLKQKRACAARLPHVHAKRAQNRTDADPFATAVAGERRELVKQALELLNASERRLIKELYLANDASDYSSIGSRLKLPHGSIGPTRARALRKLRSIINQLEPNEAECVAA